MGRPRKIKPPAAEPEINGKISLEFVVDGDGQIRYNVETEWSPLCSPIVLGKLFGSLNSGLLKDRVIEQVIMKLPEEELDDFVEGFEDTMDAGFDKHTGSKLGCIPPLNVLAHLANLKMGQEFGDHDSHEQHHHHHGDDDD